jgi:amino acid permease
MADQRDPRYDSEKGIEHCETGIKQTPDRKLSLNDRKSSIAASIVAADLLDQRFATTQRGLKSRHAQMIALGGTIGTGLFVGSGQTLALGGPAFILVSYVIITILVYFIVTAITEVATYLPVHGGTMSYYGYRYVSRSMGFAMGYLYWYALGILVPYEGMLAASLFSISLTSLYSHRCWLGHRLLAQQHQHRGLDHHHARRDNRPEFHARPLLW